MCAKLRIIAFFLCAAFLFAGCETTQAPIGTQDTVTASPYEIPPMVLSNFDASAAEQDGDVLFDFSALQDGYISLSVQSDKRLKFQLRYEETVCNYDLPGDGTPTVYPLSMGSGTYTFRVMANVSGSKYTEIWSREKTVTLISEFSPFLCPSQMVLYDADSQCVQKARELADGCTDDVAIAAAVYQFMVESIVYDHEKAETVQSGYLPDPDETLACGSGICFDYAALAAAMLRSLGIPCKLVTGYVGENEIYHAWNEIYLSEQGWITVEIKAGADLWKRVDITFAASGTDSAVTDNDALYTARYIY